MLSGFDMSICHCVCCIMVCQYRYFWSKLTFDIIWYVNCAWATAFIFDTPTGVLVKVSTFLIQKMYRPEGDLNPQTFGFMPNALTYWAIRARHFCPMFLDTDSGGIDIFSVKLKHLICALCAGNSIHFRHTNGCPCESVKVFETENISTWRGLEPSTFEFMPNALTYWAIRARHLLSHVFKHWLWRYRYFLG